MARGDCWKQWAECLRKYMMTNGIAEITKTTAEIHSETGTTETVASLQKAGFWNATQRGIPSWTAITRAGFELGYAPTDAGTVEQVTFRLNKTWRDILVQKNS